MTLETKFSLGDTVWIAGNGAHAGIFKATVVAVSVRASIDKPRAIFYEVVPQTVSDPIPGCSVTIEEPAVQTTAEEVYEWLAKERPPLLVAPA